MNILWYFALRMGKAGDSDRGYGGSRRRQIFWRRGILRQKNQMVTCLKVAHHGSRYSSCTPWLEAVDHRLAVISCGEDNFYGHPHLETMERFKEEKIPVWQTSEKGAVFSSK